MVCRGLLLFARLQYSGKVFNSKHRLVENTADSHEMPETWLSSDWSTVTNFFQRLDVPPSAISLPSHSLLFYAKNRSAFNCRFILRCRYCFSCSVSTRAEMTVFCNVTLCILIENYQCFSGNHSPDGGNNKQFRNVGQFLRDYTDLHPRRQSSSLKSHQERRSVIKCVSNYTYISLASMVVFCRYKSTANQIALNMLKLFSLYCVSDI
jgi:hypothetical protein